VRRAKKTTHTKLSVYNVTHCSSAGPKATSIRAKKTTSELSARFFSSKKASYTWEKVVQKRRDSSYGENPYENLEYFCTEKRPNDLKIFVV